MKSHASVVIIGAGISGASIAYHLAQKGMTDIVVIERSYIGSGATGRCGAGVRQQWGTELNCRLAKKSIDFYSTMNEALDYPGDIDFKQEGYLVVASTLAEAEQFKQDAALQNRCGIPTQHMTPEEALAMVPYLNIKEVSAANFCPTDGHLNPFTTLDAFVQAAKRLGVSFHTNTTVTDLKRDALGICSVTTDQGSIATRIVVNAAGGWTQAIANMVGVELPLYSENHEILVTEQVEPLLKPMVISFSKNIYCQQTPHGAFLMGRSDPDMSPGESMHSTWGFLEAMAQTVTDLLPPVGQLRVLRQWGGLYNMSPDHQPIVSAVEDVPGFYVACGFSGHGFMLAPMTGLLISEMILNEPPSLPIEALSLNRFSDPSRIVKEKSVV